MSIMLRKLKTGLSMILDRRWPDLVSAFRSNLSRQEPSDIVAGVWDDATGLAGTQWQDTPGIGKRWNQMITGDPDQGYIEYVVEKYLTATQPSHVLSLGCGNGWWEQAWAAKYPFSTVIGYDISPRSIETARRSAREMATRTVFEYQVADVNSLNLGTHVFDLVLMNAALHHADHLEHVLSQVASHLSAEGLFVLNEFVGPSRFQWTDRQLEIINGLLAVMPHRYRESRLIPGRYKAQVSRPTIEHMLRTDPSEAVRSAEIMHVLPDYFEIVECKPWGGAVLHLLLYEIAGNFSENRPEDVRLLHTLFEIEDQLLQLGDIGSDFVFMVCRSK